MATAPRRAVKIHYRKLDQTMFSSAVNLQASLAACLMKANPKGVVLAKDPPSRHHIEAQEYGTLILNEFTSHKDYFRGELVRFEPGANLPLVDMAGGTSAYNLKQLKAPRGHAPLRGLLYFLVVGNDVMVLESDVSNKRLETYLSWLLSVANNTLAQPCHLMLLADHEIQDGDGGDGGHLNEIEKIVLKPKPVEGPPLVPAYGGETKVSSMAVAETDTWQVLRAAGLDDADLNSILEGATSLEVILQLRFKSGRRRKTVGAEDINRLLRNTPDDELTLFGPDGKESKGRLVKLNHPAHILLKDSLMDPDDVARALAEAYAYFLNNGYITG